MPTTNHSFRIISLQSILSFLATEEGANYAEDEQVHCDFIWGDGVICWCEMDGLDILFPIRSLILIPDDRILQMALGHLIVFGFYEEF